MASMPFYTWGIIMVRSSKMSYIANLLSLFYLLFLLSSFLPFVRFLCLIMLNGNNHSYEDFIILAMPFSWWFNIFKYINKDVFK